MNWSSASNSLEATSKEMVKKNSFQKGAFGTDSAVFCLASFYLDVAVAAAIIHACLNRLAEERLSEMEKAN